MINRFSRSVTAIALSFVLLLSLSVAPHALPDKISVDKVNIVIRPQTYNELNKKNNKHREFPVLVSVNGSDYTSASISSRGNSSFDFGIYHDKKRLPYKLSFTAAPDSLGWENSDYKLNNSYTLFSLIAEYLAIKIFEHMDYPVYGANPAFITINDVDFGLYLGVESVNKEFVLKHFGADALEKGNLYKALTDIPEDAENLFYNSAVGTLRFESGNENHETLKAFLQAIDFGEDFFKYLDIDSLILFYACTAASGGFDTFLTSRHNYYIYETGGKLFFLPWDLSFAFFCFVDDHGILPHPEDDSTSYLFNQVMAVDEYREKYFEYIEEIRQTFLKPEIINPIVKDMIDLLRDYYKRDLSSYYDTDLVLSMIEDSNILYQGNVFLSLNETYKQLKEQMDGKTNFFYVPEGTYENALDVYGEEGILSKNKTDLVQKICNNYFSAYYTLLAPNGEPVYLLIPAFIVALIGLYLLYRLPKGKKRKRH